MPAARFQWFRKNLNLILGVIAIITSLAAVVGWSRESLGIWAASKVAASAQADTLGRLDARVVAGEARIGGIEVRLAADERSNDVEHARLLAELPLIKTELGEIKTDLRTLNSRLH